MGENMSEDQLRRELQLQGRHLEQRLDAEIRRLSEHITAQRDQINAALAAADRAVDKAESAARKQLEAHNGLIRQMQEKDATYASQTEVKAVERNIVERFTERDKRFARIESFQAKVIGGLVVLGAIGVANFVKLFTG